MAKRKFVYHKRSKDDLDKRSRQSANNREGIVKDNFKSFVPAPGDNMIRILPPTFEESKHYGYDVWVHYKIGSDESTFVCPNKMLGEACPICEESKRARDSGDEEYAKELTPKRRVLIWLLDREKEAKDEEPVFWAMPWTIDRDISKLSKDKRTGEIYYVDDPDNGYDIEFEKTGKGFNTKYLGLAISRHATFLGNKSDHVLDFIEDNPLDSIVIHHDNDYTTNVFTGVLTKNPHHDYYDAEYKSKKKRRSGSKSARDEPTWESIHDMTFDELDSLAEEKDLDVFAPDFEEEADFADAICKSLHIKEPGGRSKRDNSDDEKDEKPARSRGRKKDDDDEEDEKPARRRELKKEKPKDEDDWKSIHAMDLDELDAFAEKKDIEFYSEDYNEAEDFADDICKNLKIKKPRRSSRDDEDGDDDTSRRRRRIRNVSDD